MHYSSFDMKQESIYANFRRESHVLKGIAFSFIRLFLLDFGTVSTVWYFFSSFSYKHLQCFQIIWVHPWFSGVRVSRSLDFCVVFCRLLFDLWSFFLLVIVSSILLWFSFLITPLASYIAQDRTCSDSYWLNISKYRCSIYLKVERKEGVMIVRFTCTL